MIVLLALDVLEALLPELLDSWLGQATDAMARASAHRKLRARLVNAQETATRVTKPRIRLKPELLQVQA